MAHTPPKVLLATPCFPPAFGGIERLSMRLVEHLSSVRLHVVASRGAPTGDPPRLPRDVSARWVPNEPRGGRVATARLNAALIAEAVRWRPALVLALHTRTMPAARFAARAVGARVVLTVHAREMDEQPRLAAAAVRWADAIVVISEHARTLALAARADENRIDLIHPGVDLPEAQPVQVTERRGPRRIVTVSRIDDEHKGHMAMLRALPLIRERVPDIRWSVIGDGRLLPGLRSAATALGLDGTVEFLGRVSDERRDDLLRRSHVFAMLSQVPENGAGEGFGIVFVEAGAHGLPVVAGRVPGVVDAVRDGETGILVNPSDTRAAADALVSVLSDPVLAKRLAAGGRRWAMDLACPRMAARYGALVQRVIAKPAASSTVRSLGWAADLIRGVPEPPGENA